MKIKFDKKLLISIGISILVAAGLTAILAIIALFSWGVIFALLAVILIPFIKVIVDIYEEEECLDLQELWEYLTEKDDNNDFIKPCD